MSAFTRYLLFLLVLFCLIAAIFAVPPPRPPPARAAIPRGAIARVKPSPRPLSQRPARQANRALKAPIDIVLLADPMYSVGVAAIINAARTHTTAPVRFWVGFDGEPALLIAYLSCVGVDNTGVTVRRPISIVDIEALKTMNMAKGKERLTSSANFARFTLPQLFPELTTIWYLDVDTLPLSDLTGPTREFEASGAAIRPVLRPGTIAKQFPDPVAISGYYRKMYHRPFGINAPSWNAGVWQADLRQWGSIAENAAKWIVTKAEYKGRTPLWKLATQPIMYLLFHDDVRNKLNFMPTSWNCESILLTQDYGARVPPGCDLVHWNGAEKPWDPAARGHALWMKYLPAFGRDECQSLQPKIVVPSPSASPAPVHCTNRKLDGDETDVDCGGTVCKPCAAGLACLKDSDCFGNAEDITSESESMVVCADQSTRSILVCVDFRVADEDDGDYDDADDRPKSAALNVVVTGLPLPLFSGRVSAALSNTLSNQLKEAGVTSVPPSDVLVVRAQGSGLGMHARADTQVTKLAFRFLVPEIEPTEDGLEVQDGGCRDAACISDTLNKDTETLAEALKLTFTVALPELVGIISVELSPAAAFVPTKSSPAPTPAPSMARVQPGDARFWIKALLVCLFLWSITKLVGVKSMPGCVRVCRAPASKSGQRLLPTPTY